MLLAGTKALSVDTASMVIAVADMVQVVAPDTTQSQNQTDSVLERLQDRAEEQEDLLNILD
jgi:ketol-acid reductoisomerase